MILEYSPNVFHDHIYPEYLGKLESMTSIIVTGKANDEDCEETIAFIVSSSFCVTEYHPY